MPSLRPLIVGGIRESNRKTVDPFPFAVSYAGYRAHNFDVSSQHPKTDDVFKSSRDETVPKDTGLTEFLVYSRNK